MKKYIPVFGPQELFDGAPDDAEMAYETANRVRVYYKKCNSLKFFSNSKWVRVLNEKAMIIHAMRRIIKEPKRWTWEDKKVWRLPEVGAKCRQGHKDEIVIAVTEKFVVTECQDMSVCTTRKDVFMRSYNPIETPEEKAEQLRNE